MEGPEQGVTLAQFGSSTRKSLEWHALGHGREHQSPCLYGDRPSSGISRFTQGLLAKLGSEKPDGAALCGPSRPEAAEEVATMDPSFKPTSSGGCRLQI
jgi:hypothetical protein